MDRSDKNVAFDVHQATVVALVQDARGRTLAHTVLPTEERAILQFVGGMRGRISVVFEECTLAPSARPARGSSRLHSVTSGSMPCRIRRAGFAPASCTPNWTCAASSGLGPRRPWWPRLAGIRLTTS